MLNRVKIPENTGEFIRPRFTHKSSECKALAIKDCKLDDFHAGEKYLQIVLGRFMITSNCFTNCNNYFSMTMNKWSVFKNDVFIRHMIHNNFFYKKYNKLPLDPIFPVRIVMSSKYLIPPHRIKKVGNFIKEYGYDFFKGRAISDRAEKMVAAHYPELMQKITQGYPKSTITSRELCLLKEDGLYFYIAKKSGEAKYVPYIFVSEKPMSAIREHYKGSEYEFEYL
jgi:hypothetical protein